VARFVLEESENEQFGVAFFELPIRCNSHI
jgi:hypothetical protein